VTAVEGVVMAAGQGRRLRPLTERYAKPVLPLDGRPVLALLLRELALAGIGRVWLVTGHLAEQVEALAGDGSAFGIEVQTVHQPRPDGSADTVRRAIAAGAKPPLLVTAADTLYTRGDVGRFVAASAAADAAIAVRRHPRAGPNRVPVRIVDGRVARVLDDDPANPLGSAPLWTLGPALLELLPDLPGPPFELATLLQRAVDTQRHVAGVEIGRTRDLTDPFDLVEENFPYLKRLSS
jgi:NDP-sugar pyrophosphorylase family protein